MFDDCCWFVGLLRALMLFVIKCSQMVVGNTTSEKCRFLPGLWSTATLMAVLFCAFVMRLKLLVLSPLPLFLALFFFFSSHSSPLFVERLSPPFSSQLSWTSLTVAARSLARSTPKSNGHSKLTSSRTREKTCFSHSLKNSSTLEGRSPTNGNQLSKPTTTQLLNITLAETIS